MTKCFKLKINNILHILNELLTASLHIVLLISIFYPKYKLNFNVTNICINIITASWALNISCSIIKFIEIGIEKFKKFRARKKVDNTTKISEFDKIGKTEERSFEKIVH